MCIRDRICPLKLSAAKRERISTSGFPTRKSKDAQRRLTKLGLSLIHIFCAQLNGGTHMSLEDMALMRAIANMVVYEPTDAEQFRQAIPQIAYNDAPTYIRIHRTQADTVFGADYRFKLGKADVLRDGKDVVIFCSGIMVIRSLAAAELLAEQGIDAAVVNVHTLKPLSLIHI